MQKKKRVILFVAFFQVIFLNGMNAQDISGTWMNVNSKTKVRIIQSVNAITYTTAFGRQFRGSIQNNSVSLSFRYKSLNETPERLPLVVRQQMLRDSIMIKGQLEKTQLNTEKLSLTINSPSYNQTTGAKTRDSLITFDLIRNPIQFEDNSGQAVTLVADASQPYPVIKLDAVSASDVSISNGKAVIRVKGQISDALGDLYEDTRLKINSIRFEFLDPESGSEDNEFITMNVSVTNAEKKDYWKPFPYEGRFEGTITVPAWAGQVDVYAKATNIAGNTGIDGFTILADTNMVVTGVSNHKGTGPGLFKPLMVKVYDPSPPNIEAGLEDVQLMNGKKLQLEVIPGNLTGAFRTELPVIALNKKPTAEVSNLVYAVGSAPASKIKYARYDEEFYWSYTTHSPPNYFKYAAGTTVEHEVRSNVFRTWQADDVDCLRRNSDGETENEPFIRARILGPLPAAQGLEPGYRIQLEIDSVAGLYPQKELLFYLSERAGNKTRERSDIGSFYVLYRPKTVIITVDGLGYQSIQEILANNTPPVANTFKRIFEGSLNAHKPVLSALPTITWCNWPGIFSMQSPKDHGVIGNSYFEREKPGQDPFNIPSVLLDNLSVARGYLGDHAKINSGSLYDALSQAYWPRGGHKLNVQSIHQWYHKSSDNLVEKEWRMYPGSTFRVFTQKDHSVDAAKLLDKITSKRAPDAFCADEEAVDVLAVYFPGPDNIAHAIGEKRNSKTGNYRPGPFMPNDKDPSYAIREHMEIVTDRYFKKLVDVIEDRGYLYATLFVLTADHGLHAFQNTKQFTVTLDNGLEDFFESLDLEVYTDHIGEFLNSQEVAYGPNGGMAHIYLNSNSNWQQPPSKTRIEKVARALYIEATGGTAKDPFSNTTVNYTAANANPRYTINYADLGPKPNPSLRGATDYGAFGTPPAIFVKVCQDGDRSCSNERNTPNHFRASFKWVRFVQANGTIVYSSVDSFLLARRNARTAANAPCYPEFNWPEFALRLEEMNDKNPNGSRTGDIVVFTDGYTGYLTINDGDEYNAWHGGATESESYIPLYFNMVGDVVEKTFIERAVESAYSDIQNQREYLRNWEMGKILMRIYRNMGR